VRDDRDARISIVIQGADRPQRPLIEGDVMPDADDDPNIVRARAAPDAEIRQTSYDRHDCISRKQKRPQRVSAGAVIR
jgi:hypothetical protein